MNRVSVILVSTVATLSLTAAGWRADRPLSEHEAHVRSEAARLRKADTRAQAPTPPSKQTLASQTRVTPDVILSRNETRVGLRMQARF